MTSPTAVALQPQNSPSSSLPKPPDSGILTLSSEVSALGRKLSVLDDEIRRTDKLKQSSDDLRSPLLACINKRLPAVAENYLRASDLGELLQQKARLDELAVLVKALSPAIVALDKQTVLLAAYTATTEAKRNLVRFLVNQEYSKIGADFQGHPTTTQVENPPRMLSRPRFVNSLGPCRDRSSWPVKK